MCTVTFIQNEEGFILTSNRDEQILRPTIPPTFYGKLFYPKDVQAGGTWIASSRQQKVACLLNGAFEKHIRKESYIKSRGQVLLDSFEAISHEFFIENYELKGVEPFTLLLIDYAEEFSFWELVWDGSQKHYTNHEYLCDGIWSSATLYSAEQRQKREKWFQQWINTYSNHSTDLLAFHQTKHSEEEQNNILMNRNQLKTVSISQIVVRGKKAHFYYHDLLTNLITQTAL